MHPGSDQDIFILKLNNNGEHLWSKGIGGSGKDEGYSLAVSSSNDLLVAGNFQGVVDFDPGPSVASFTATTGTWAGGGFVLKLDASGNYLWNKVLISNVETRTWDLALDASDNIYSTGFFRGTLDADPGTGVLNFSANYYNDIFIHKMNAQGGFEWARHFPGSGYDDQGRAIKVLPNQNVVVAGFFQATADFDPSASSTNMIQSNGIRDLFLTELDPAGNIEFVETLGGSGDDYILTLEEDGLGNFVFGGFATGVFHADPGMNSSMISNNGDRDAFLVKWGINSSSNIYVNVDNITPTNCNLNDGAIGLSAPYECSSYTYNWSTGDTTKNVNNLAEGDYYVTVTSSSGTSTTLGPITIISVTDLALNFNQSNDSTTIAEVSGGSAPYQYNWSNGSQDSVITAYGSYTVTITDANGCEIIETIDVISAIEEHIVQTNFFKIYPNSTQGPLTIEMELNQAQNIQVQIIDVKGRVLRRISKYVDEEDQVQLNLSNLNSGLYFVQLIFEDGSYLTRKVQVR